ncbi:MAG: type I restriction enzyme HsdR N-terminal domain-containing protein [Bacteroidia bacterium]|nr:type I restriction enzyme HsdR N-terminal domain-containing protein [Bacteroidia bacterium]
MAVLNDFPALNLPHAKLRLTVKEGREMVWDIIRKRWVRLTPEEWVRQHWIHALCDHAAYPASLMQVECKVPFNGLDKRFDVVMRNRDLSIFFLLECKAPEVPLTRDTLLQASVYARVLQPQHIFLSNGLQHYLYAVEKGQLRLLEGIPGYRL